jgi:DUF4097 and DUF4098 domain-containing protein YvlB
MEYIRTLTKEFEVGDRCDLRVENRSGAVVVRGEERTSARVEVVARIWAETDAEADDQMVLVERGITQDGTRVHVRAPALPQPSGFMFLFGRGARIDYQIVVPRATLADIASRSGRVEVEMISGPLDIQSSSGSVAASEIGSAVSIAARSGSVRAERIEGALSVESRSGRLQVRDCRGNATVAARSGSVQIEDIAGDLRVETRSGSNQISNVQGALHLRSMSGSVRYEGPVNKNFDIEVFSGSVGIAVDPSSVFFLDAETMSGAVASDLPVREGDRRPAAGASGPTLRVRTKSGSVGIRRR